MKQRLHLFYLLCLTFALSSCQDEGFGGKCSIEGYVYNIVHHNKNFSFMTDTVPAAEYRVYILAGENGAVLDDIRTNHKGMYRIDYLRKGTYPVYAYSEYPNDIYEEEMVEVKVGKGLNVADTIFVHTGKAYGTAVIMGSVYANYYHNGDKWGGAKPFDDVRVYIKNLGEPTYFDDVRVGDLGIFAFEQILPGDYEICVVHKNEISEIPSAKYMQVTVTETGKIYQLPEEVEVESDEDGDGILEYGYYTFLINVSV